MDGGCGSDHAVGRIHTRPPQRSATELTSGAMAALLSFQPASTPLAAFSNRLLLRFRRRWGLRPGRHPRTTLMVRRPIATLACCSMPLAHVRPIRRSALVEGPSSLEAPAHQPEPDRQAGAPWFRSRLGVLAWRALSDFDLSLEVLARGCCMRITPGGAVRQRAECPTPDSGVRLPCPTGSRLGPCSPCLRGGPPHRCSS